MHFTALVFKDMSQNPVIPVCKALGDRHVSENHLADGLEATDADGSLLQHLQRIPNDSLSTPQGGGLPGVVKDRRLHVQYWGIGSWQQMGGDGCQGHHWPICRLTMDCSHVCGYMREFHS